MIDALGHLFYLFLVLGMVLISRRSAWGWALRLAGDLGWFSLGVALGLSSVMLWSAVFALIDFRGWQNWREEAA